MSDRVTTGVGPWLVSAETEIDLNGGYAYVEVWEGSDAECLAKQSVLIARGATKLKRSPKGDGAWQIRCSFPDDQTNPNKGYVDVMELEVNATMRSCYQSPIYRARFADFNSVTQFSSRANQTLPVVGDCARKYLSGLPRQESNGQYRYNGTDYATRELAVQAEVGARLNLISGLVAGERNSAIALFENVAFRGVTSFIEYNHVFRRRVTAGSPRAITANQSGGGMIWTSAEVIAFEGLANNDWFYLPPDVQWHKDKPRVLAAYGQKTEISYTYTEIVTASALFYEAWGEAVLIDI